MPTNHVTTAQGATRVADGERLVLESAALFQWAQRTVRCRGCNQRIDTSPGAGINSSGTCPLCGQWLTVTA